MFKQAAVETWMSNQRRLRVRWILEAEYRSTS